MSLREVRLRRTTKQSNHPGRTAIITGAASGIGLESTIRFSTDFSYNPIYAVDKDPSIVTMFDSAQYPNIIPVQVDVRDRGQVEHLISRVSLETGRLDVVVNAAGVMVKGKPGTFRNKDGSRKELLKKMDAVNLQAPIIMMMKSFQVMRKNDGGIIILVMLYFEVKLDANLCLCSQTLRTKLFVTPV